jgi:hypothetical protein
VYLSGKLFEIANVKECMTSLDEARKVRKRIEAEILNKENVNGMAIGYKIRDNKETDDICIIVYVDKKEKNIQESQMIPKEIEGIKTDVRQRPNIVDVNGSFGFDTTIHPQLIGGIGIGPVRRFGNRYENGTLSAVVIDNQSGQPMALSCAHVLAVDNNYSIGDEISQPAGIGTRIGQLEQVVLSNNTDAAVARIYDNVNYAFFINHIGPLTGVAYKADIDELYSSGQRTVRKSGITTGLTFGMIETLEESITVNYPYIGPWSFAEQIKIRSSIQGRLFSNGGDSGSCIIDVFGRVIGIVMGGGSSGFTYANHIQDVTNALNISFS